MDVSSARVAVLASCAERSAHLQAVLETVGLCVVHRGGLDAASLQTMEQATPNVLLVDLDSDSDAEIELIDGLLEHSALPMMFNDSGSEGSLSNYRWARRLAQKLVIMAEASDVLSDAVPSMPVAMLPVDVLPDDAAPVTPPAAGAATNIWVLGASLGGPQAVREFLTAVDGELPVAFVLVQHIGANHVQLLAEQLNRVSAFKVLPAKPGHVLKHGEVILAPADKHLQLTADGYVALTTTPADAVYSPSIDHVMSDLAGCYGARIGAIIFSGMGDDGAEGCIQVARSGGIVWAQDVKSCVISSMPDQVRKTGTVTYSANPPAIAAHLYDYYREAE